MSSKKSWRPRPSKPRKTRPTSFRRIDFALLGKGECDGRRSWQMSTNPKREAKDLLYGEADSPFCGSFAPSSVNRQKATRFSVGPCEQLPATRHEYIQFESGDRILVCELNRVVHREAGFKQGACESKPLFHQFERLCDSERRHVLLIKHANHHVRRRQIHHQFAQRAVARHLSDLQHRKT